MVFAISKFQQHLCANLNCGGWIAISAYFHRAEAQFIVRLDNVKHPKAKRNEELNSLSNILCSYKACLTANVRIDEFHSMIQFHKFSPTVQSLSIINVECYLNGETIFVITSSSSASIFPCSIPFAPILGILFFWVPFPDFETNAKYLEDLYSLVVLENSNATVEWLLKPNRPFSTMLNGISIDLLPDSLKFFSFVILLPIASVTFLLLFA